MNRRERLWLARAGLVVLFAANLPYLIAWAATPANAHFTGLVFNPIDSHSYLAKMRQGFEGSWRFHLAFTPERSPGAYIFLYHLALGHLARWTGLPLIAIYHGARVLGGLVMLGGIYVLTSFLSDHPRERGTMFLLTVTGSGLGWLLLMMGVQTADLWVAEAFPAYSLMVNAHFAPAIALMMVVACSGLRVLARETGIGDRAGATWPWGLAMTLAAVLLGAIQPFALVPVFGGLGIAATARASSNGGRFMGVGPWRAAAWIVGAATVAAAYPLYMQAAIRSDPLLVAWNEQNVTGSVPVWDWALSYGLILVLAVWGCGAAFRRLSDGDFLTMGWALVTFAGMYLPVALQRRLSIGLGVPIGFLAGMGWWRGVRKHVRVHVRGLARGLIIAFSALTPIFLIVAVATTALGAEVPNGRSWFYLSDGEWAALEWLRQRPASHQEAVVLCAPQTGTFIPAWSSQRVVYGHPFETVNAEQREERVKAYWTGQMSDVESAWFLRENDVDYIFIGPREQALMQEAEVTIQPGDAIFQQGDTRIYAVGQ